jgi:hypothetical protein
MTREDKMKEGLIESFLEILAERGGHIKPFIVIVLSSKLNSFSNFIATGLKLLWIQLENKQKILRKINSFFESNTNAELHASIGLNIYLMVLKNLQLSNYSLGYTKYRSIQSSFQTEALLTWYQNTKATIMHFAQAICQGKGNSDLEGWLEQALEVMSQILNYPYTICYLEFTADVPSENNSMTMYPDNWKEVFIDLQYLEMMLTLLNPKNPGRGFISGNSKIFIIKNLSKTASCKKGLIPTECDYLSNLLLMPLSIIEFVTGTDEEAEMWEELVDMCERIINVFGLIRIIELEEKASIWFRSFLKITSQVMSTNFKVTICSCLQINEKGFNSVCNIWKSVITASKNALLDNAIQEFLNLYLKTLFCSQLPLNVFSDISFATHERLKEMFDERFKIFTNINSKHKELSHLFLMSLSNEVFGQFQVFS